MYTSLFPSFPLCVLASFTCTVPELLSCDEKILKPGDVKGPPVVWPFVKSSLIRTSSVLFAVVVVLEPMMANKQPKTAQRAQAIKVA